MQRRPIDYEKLPKDIKEILDTKFPPTVKTALLSGADEHDFIRAASFLVQMADNAMLETMGEIPPFPSLTKGMRCMGTAQARLREAAMHLADSHGHMKEFEAQLAEFRKGEGGGIVVAQEGDMPPDPLSRQYAGRQKKK